MNIKAIETQYQGYRFRSRLEARWAVFFDALGVKWEYEKEGFEFDTGERYLPDFWLPDTEMWVEVKGQDPTEIEILKLMYLQESTEHTAFFFKQIPDSASDNKWYEDCSNYLQVPAWHIPFPVDACAYHPMKFDSDDLGYHVLCPVCKNEYVHFLNPIVTESDDYTAWQGRGVTLRIPMYCENGHMWLVRYGFHKGYSFCAVEESYEDVSNPGLALATNNVERFEQALIEARSARFEHGEKPRVYA